MQILSPEAGQKTAISTDSMGIATGTVTLSMANTMSLQHFEFAGSTLTRRNVAVSYGEPSLLITNKNWSPPLSVRGEGQLMFAGS